MKRKKWGMEQIFIFSSKFPCREVEGKDSWLPSQSSVPSSLLLWPNVLDGSTQDLAKASNWMGLFPVSKSVPSCEGLGNEGHKLGEKSYSSL